MKTRLLWLCAFGIAGCAEQPINRAPPARAYVPPPRPAGTVARPAHPAVPVVVAPAPRAIPAAGPLSGSTVGRYMDAQERDLREHLQGMGVGVARPGDQIVLSMLADELFMDSNSRLTSRGERTLATIAVIVRHYDRTWLYVKGFADAAGSARANGVESQRRAAAVARALIANGVNGRRLAVQGFGSARFAIVSGAHIQKPRDRRIEIRIRANASG